MNIPAGIRRQGLSFLVLMLPVAAWAGVPGEARNLIVTGYDPVTGNISLTFEPACGAAGHHIEFGLLQDVGSYGWSGQECGIGTGGVYTQFDPGPGSYFFVIVGDDGAGVEGSYGKALIDGIAVERPEDTFDPDCSFVQDLDQTCEVHIDLFETIGVADAPVVLPPLLLVVSETIGVSDAPAVLPEVTVDVTETIVVTDTPGAEPSVLVTVSETIVVTDTPGVVPPVVLELTETIEVTDAPVAEPSVLVSVSETIVVTDTPGVVPPVVLELTETIGVADAPVAEPSVLVSVSETIVVTDTPAVLPPVVLEVFETIVVTDAPTAEPSFSAIDSNKRSFLGMPAQKNPAQRAEEGSP